jgi:hypothetical protein
MTAAAPLSKMTGHRRRPPSNDAVALDMRAIAEAVARSSDVGEAHGARVLR